MRNNPSVTDLVTRARTGDKQAWDTLAERYAPLVWSICRRYRLGTTDAQDAGQNVWLRLVEHLDNLRDPAALPGWLATTTRHECVRVLRAAHSPQTAALGMEADNIPDEQAVMAEPELLAAERHAALREALSHLPPRHQQLLILLTHDPPAPYTQISATLGIPIGSIGPMRSRCLQQLRSDPAITALINATPPPQQASDNHPQMAGSQPTRTGRSARGWTCARQVPRPLRLSVQHLFGIESSPDSITFCNRNSWVVMPREIGQVSRTVVTAVGIHARSARFKFA
jgi:RNA polymerase sigma factor (sigma-70 family)